MRLFGDPACAVELVQVSVLPETADPDQRPYLRGGGATVTCAADGARWSVLTWGGARQRLLLAGDRVVVIGTNAVTGERFTVPSVLACTDPSWTARFSRPEPRRARPLLRMAG